MRGVLQGEGDEDRAGDVAGFRQYNEAPARVIEFYCRQHTELTYARASDLNYRFVSAPKRAYSLSELLRICDGIFDPSDPDLAAGEGGEGGISQTEHAYQVAEGALRAGLPLEYVALGMVHDLGKAAAALLGIDMTFLVGDTYPLGCPFETEHITYGESLLNNEDGKNPLYNSGHGVYRRGCGFSSMLFTGHDELIYHALRASDHRLPEWALYVLRFHSFYPWHTHGAYSAYADEVDHAYLPHLLEFNRCDLYTKCATPVSEERMRELDEIVARFIPDGIQFPIATATASTPRSEQKERKSASL